MIPWMRRTKSYWHFCLYLYTFFSFGLFSAYPPCCVDSNDGLGFLAPDAKYTCIDDILLAFNGRRFTIFFLATTVQEYHWMYRRGFSLVVRSTFLSPSIVNIMTALFLMLK